MRGLVFTGLLLGLVVVLRRVLLIVTIDGFSMAPTLTHGDRVLALRPGAGRRPRRNSVVVLWSTTPYRRKLLVKRVIAIGGDPDPRGAPAGSVPDGELFVAGDSRYSHDSHNYGPVPEDLVIGVVVGRMPLLGASPPPLLSPELGRQA